MQASEALSHPLVVWAAWLRVNEWYRTGNLAPQPELCHWRLQPEAEVRKLAAKLRSGKWKPEEWAQLPYPKRGACLRHYVMPTVRDQVAFMAYLVLLGPLADNQFYPFAFGNRLYRPLAWNTRGKPRWEQRAYPMLNRHTFLPYARSHGLYRRVANWTVSQMTKATLPEEDYAGRVHQPSDYDTKSLPRWVQEEWWQDGGGESSDRAFWASLDIQLAYPSVRLSDLREALVDLTGRSRVFIGRSLSGTQDIDFSAILLGEVLDGYPQTLVDGLADGNLREELAKSLVKALKRAIVKGVGIPREAWKPHHARADLPPDNIGLPTGLAISGLLLNVVLHRVDKSAYEYLAETSGSDRGAIVRFADDMYVLSRSSEGLFRLIDVVWGAIEANNGARPIRRKSKSNLYVNLSKIAPDSVQKVVCECLKARHWRTCKKTDCDELKPSKKSKKASLAQWWQSNGEGLRVDMARTSVGPGEVGPFVTTLVERLSAIGNDTLGDRFGQGARNRQVQLHDLARFDIADEQVRADTRRAFAVNRLARAWLSKERSQAHHELVEIRRSVAKVFNETPWKFSLWGAVVRTAARRVVGSGDHRDEDDEEARQWLLGLLTCVSKIDDCSWLADWPEEGAESPHREPTDWRHHYLSFHRAAFWRALADVVGRLYAHEETRRDHRRLSGPSPRIWATRAVPEGLHEHVAGTLADVDTWTRHLYGEAPEGIPRWELDQLVAACLAGVRRSEVAEAWRRCDLSVQSASEVAVPDGVLGSAPKTAPKTNALLEAHGRIVKATRRGRGVLDRAAVAQLLLSSRDNQLGDVLFPKALRAADPAYSLAVARKFDCADRVSTKVVQAALRHAEPRLRDDPLALQEYGYARSVLLGRKDIEDMSWP